MLAPLNWEAGRFELRKTAVPRGLSVLAKEAGYTNIGMHLSLRRRYRLLQESEYKPFVAKMAGAEPTSCHQTRFLDFSEN